MNKKQNPIICEGCIFGEIVKKEKYRPLFASSKYSELVYEDSVICKKLHRVIKSISYYKGCKHKIVKKNRTIEKYF